MGVAGAAAEVEQEVGLTGRELARRVYPKEQGKGMSWAV